MQHLHCYSPVKIPFHWHAKYQSGYTELQSYRVSAADSDIKLDKDHSFSFSQKMNDCE